MDPSKRLKFLIKQKLVLENPLQYLVWKLVGFEHAYLRYKASLQRKYNVFDTQITLLWAP